MCLVPLYMYAFISKFKMLIFQHHFSRNRNGMTSFTKTFFIDLQKSKSLLDYNNNQIISIKKIIYNGNEKKKKKVEQRRHTL